MPYPVMDSARRIGETLGHVQVESADLHRPVDRANNSILDRIAGSFIGAPRSSRYGLSPADKSAIITRHGALRAMSGKSVLKEPG